MNRRIRAHVRPDGRLYISCPERWTAAAAFEAVTVASRHDLPTIAFVPGGDEEALAALRAAGFSRSREEAVVNLSVVDALRALGGDEAPPDLEVRSAADVDEDRLRELDDELRQDVPGTSGWASTPAEFRAHTFDDPAFDARTYLVAVTPAGELVGLVRIWMNPGRPRLGLLGVRREWRRRGIAWLLLRRALAAVEGHGGTEVVAEFDVGNAASGAIAERLGARRIATRIELAHQPGTRGRGPCAEKTHHVA